MKYTLISFLFFYAQCLFCQQTTPFFRNFTKSDYQGENANWDITQDDKGIIYSANNYNLLTYNGNFWKKYRLPDDLVIRSVQVIGDTLFSGAYEEFGYWLRDKTQQLKYFSLSDDTKDTLFNNEAVWNIFRYKEFIAFQSFKSLFLYDRNTKTTQKINFPPVSAIFAYNIQNQIYLATKEDGIYKLDHKEFNKEIWSKPLEDYAIQSLVAYKDGFLLATQFHGIYYYDGKELSVWLSADSKALAGTELNNISKIHNKVCIGSINNGLLVINDEKELEYTINTRNGLANNTVLRQYVDKENNLWLGLDNGMACIYLTQPIFTYSDSFGDLGTLYAISNSLKDSIQYLGSNHGVFVKTKEELSFLEGSNGQVWSLTQTDHGIICGHNNGTFLIEDKNIKKISNVNGGTRLVKIPDHEAYLQAHYTGLTKFEYRNNQWESSFIRNTNSRITEIVFDKIGNLWVKYPHKGVVAYKYHYEQDSVSLQKNYSEEVANHVIELHGDIFLSRTNKLFKYDQINDTLVRDNILENKLSPFEDLMAFKDKYIVAKKNNTVTIFNTETEQNFKLSTALIGDRLVQDFDYAKEISDNLYLFLDNGFLQIDMEHLQIEDPNEPPKIASLKINNEEQALEESYRIPFQRNRISFQLSNNNPSSIIKKDFYYQLEGYEENWNYTNQGSITYENLPSGDYVFKVKNKSGQVESELTTYTFSVLPPWYLSKWAIIAYVFLLILIVYSVHFLNKQKYKMKQQRFETESAYQNQLKLQQEKLDNNKRIAEIEKEQLKEKLRSKSRELATYAASMAKKEEILNELENEIEKANIKNEHSKLYSRLSNLKEKQAHSEDDWKLFQRNFNEVHDDFFKALQSRFPQLTPKDLKLCAYLKMNLSSKEIAPLIGITYRSVELHRYRLRKKLELDKNENLVKFLLNVE